MRELKGRRALVTGGGSGLGEAICIKLAAEGCAVFVADVKNAEATVERIVESGGLARSLAFDVSNPQSIETALSSLGDEASEIDILINNAGVDFTKPITEITDAEWERELKVNLFGPFYLSRYALLHMPEGSNIVNVASTAAKRAWENAAAYHASKWGLLGFSHALHVEARAKKIAVTALVAGGMRTPFILERFPETDRDVLQEPSTVAEMVACVLSLPLGSVVPEVMVIPMRETSWP